MQKIFEHSIVQYISNSFRENKKFSFAKSAMLGLMNICFFVTVPVP